VAKPTRRPLFRELTTDFAEPTQHRRLMSAKRREQRALRQCDAIATARATWRFCAVIELQTEEENEGET